MSAGHPHAHANMRHPAELKQLREEGGFADLMQRWRTLDVDHDIHDLAGYNVDGTVRYLDKDFFRALLDAEYAQQIGIGPIDTGLSPGDTVACLLEHEGTEKVLLDADNPINTYDAAHEYATTAEHEMVRAKGGAPVQYERGLKAAIAFCAKKKLADPPLDLACAPLLDDPDADDKRALKELQAKGDPDAAKTPKEDLGYAQSTGDDQCRKCVHWQDDRAQELSRCEIVDGLVRLDRWCERYKKA